MGKNGWGIREEVKRKKKWGNRLESHYFPQENSPVTSRLCLLKFLPLWIVPLVEIRFLAHGPSEDTHI